jgi:uncharacterized protein (DUF1778 family)
MARQRAATTQAPRLPYLQVQVTAAQKRKVEQAARADGFLTVSGWIRQAILQVAEKSLGA